MKIFILSTLFFSTTVYAQGVSFKEIRLKPNSKFYKTDKPTIIYPIVVTKNKLIDKSINDKIRSEMIGDDSDLKNVSTKKALLNQINEGLINMYYEATYIKNNILSFSIYAEGCGAHCSSWNTYFNFDLKTGKTLNITDLISENHLDSFRVVVLNDKQKFLNQYKSEFKQNTIKEESDSVAFAGAMEEVDANCIKSVQVENFSLSESYLQIIDPCEFPHAIRALEPTFELKYTYKSLSMFLKPRFQILFSN
jgi:hypothetical protein